MYEQWASKRESVAVGHTCVSSEQVRERECGSGTYMYEFSEQVRERERQWDRYEDTHLYDSSNDNISNLSIVPDDVIVTSSSSQACTVYMIWYMLHTLTLEVWHRSVCWLAPLHLLLMLATFHPLHTYHDPCIHSPASETKERRLVPRPVTHFHVVTAPHEASVGSDDFSWWDIVQCSLGARLQPRPLAFFCYFACHDESSIYANRRYNEIETLWSMQAWILASSRTVNLKWRRG